MKRYSFANSIPEFQELIDEDKEMAFQYAYSKTFRHWQRYVWLIVPSIVGLLLAEVFESNIVQCFIIVLTVVLAMTLSDQMTKPIFKRYLLHYIQIKKESSEQTFESRFSRNLNP